jgi:hypothetical protein
MCKYRLFAITRHRSRPCDGTAAPEEGAGGVKLHLGWLGTYRGLKSLCGFTDTNGLVSNVSIQRLHY